MKRLVISKAEMQTISEKEVLCRLEKAGFNVRSSKGIQFSDVSGEMVYTQGGECECPPTSAGIEFDTWFESKFGMHPNATNAPGPIRVGELMDAFRAGSALRAPTGDPLTVLCRQCDRWTMTRETADALAVQAKRFSETAPKVTKDET